MHQNANRTAFLFIPAIRRSLNNTPVQEARVVADYHTGHILEALEVCLQPSYICHVLRVATLMKRF